MKLIWRFYYLLFDVIEDIFFERPPPQFCMCQGIMLGTGNKKGELILFSVSRLCKGTMKSFFTCRVYHHDLDNLNLFHD